MEDWTSGYIADIGYTFGYFFELNPLRARLPLLYDGVQVPIVRTACELGFGQGLSTNLHAAGSNTEWYGTDFNPGQAAFARELAEKAGTSAKLFDESFKDFCNRSDLPEFDFIGLHGIWSWISDQNRTVLVDFVRRKLKVGGLLYVSYNTLPGWSAFAPMRHLLTQHADIIGADGLGILSRINGALDFTDKLLETNPRYSQINPSAGEKLKKLREQNLHYLAHEYFNRDWNPMHFATFAEWMKPAKIDYACSASYMDHIDMVNISESQRQFLNEIPDLMLRQTVRDFMVNQQFRRDYWIKGSRRLTALERFEALRDEKIVLLYHRPDVPLKAKGALLEAELNKNIYTPILDCLSDYNSISLGKLHAKLEAHNVEFPQLIEAILILADSGRVSSAMDVKHIATAKKNSDSLNAHLLEMARSRPDVLTLSSPVTGGGIPVTRFEQLFLSAFKKGKKTPGEWAESTWSVLALQNQRLIQNGKTLESVEENLTELRRQAEEFAIKKLPILEALRVV